MDPRGIRDDATLRIPGPHWGRGPAGRFKIGRWMILATLLGCATALPLHSTPPGQLRDEIARDVPSLSRNEVIIPHELSNEARSLIHSEIGNLDDSDLGARALLDLLFDPGHLHLQYEWGPTLTANSTLAHGGGNCVSLASVLVGAARQYGGAARYVEVQHPPERRREGDLDIWASHIAVLLPSRDGMLLVDFTGFLDHWPIRFHSLSDRTLVAHFYNDRGYDLIHWAHEEGRPIPWAQARELFETATRIDPKLGHGWNNLGVALARMSELEAADSAYQRAMKTRSLYLESATQDNLISLDLRRQRDPSP